MSRPWSQQTPVGTVPADSGGHSRLFPYRAGICLSLLPRRVLPPGDHSTGPGGGVHRSPAPCEPCSPGQGHCCLAWLPLAPSRWAADEASGLGLGRSSFLHQHPRLQPHSPPNPDALWASAPTGLSGAAGGSWQLSEPAEEAGAFFKINSILKSPSFHSKPGEAAEENT